MSCNAGSRRSLDLVLLWLWYIPAVAAPIQPLAWEFPYALGSAPQKTNNDRSSHCGTTGLAVSLQCWGAGSIPSLAQLVKGLGVTAVRFTRSQLLLESNPWPRNSMCCGAAKKEKKRKKKKKKTSNDRKHRQGLHRAFSLCIS